MWLGDGSRTSTSCCFTFQFQYTYSPCVHSCSLLTLPVKDNIRKQWIPQGFSILQEKQENKTGSMTECSVRTLPPDHSEGWKQKVTLHLFSLKNHHQNMFKSNYYSPLTQHAGLLRTKNTLEQNTALTMSHVSHRLLPQLRVIVYILWPSNLPNHMFSHFHIPVISTD